jgi:predicted transcriptional regulator
MAHRQYQKEAAGVTFIPGTLARLDALALATGTNRSALIRAAVDAYLKRVTHATHTDEADAPLKTAS